MSSLNRTLNIKRYLNVSIMHLNLEMISNKNRFKSQYSLKPGSTMGNTEKSLHLVCKATISYIKIFFSVVL